MEFDHRGMAPQPNFQDSGGPNERPFWYAVARNIGRVRRRWLRANSPPLLEAQGALTVADKTVIPVTSDSGMVPEIHRGSLPD